MKFSSKDKALSIKISGNFWYHNNLLHRENNKPSVVYVDGRSFWYRFGRIHNKNNPAIIYKQRGAMTMMWYLDGRYLKAEYNDSFR
jgi:hypothetical protein